MIDDMKMLGYGNVKVVLLTDGDEAIIAFRNANIEKRFDPTVRNLASKKTRNRMATSRLESRCGQASFAHSNFMWNERPESSYRSHV